MTDEMGDDGPPFVDLWDGRTASILSPTWVLSDELSAMREAPASAWGDEQRAGAVLDLVIRRGLGVVSMAETGGPLKWPAVALAIVATWPDHGPWPFWSGFVRTCVAAYVKDLQAPVEFAAPEELKTMMGAGLAQPLAKLDPIGLAKRQANNGGDEAVAWLAGAQREMDDHADADRTKPNRQPETTRASAHVDDRLGELLYAARTVGKMWGQAIAEAVGAGCRRPSSRQAATKVMDAWCDRWGKPRIRTKGRKPSGGAD